MFCKSLHEISCRASWALPPNPAVDSLLKSFMKWHWAPPALLPCQVIFQQTGDKKGEAWKRPRATAEAWPTSHSGEGGRAGPVPDCR